MPGRLKKPCNHPGCGRATTGRFCDAHRQRRVEYRGTPAERGYDAHWRRLRAVHLEEHPVCEDCLEQGRLNDCHLEVDHVIPISVRPDLRLDSNNLRTLCRRHHAQKTRRDQDGQEYGQQR